MSKFCSIDGLFTQASAESVALKLSNQGRQLLRGNRDERIELMHLHTTTHGTNVGMFMTVMLKVISPARLE